jgi:hypothetical protein
MSFVNRLLLVGLLSVGIAAATTAQAGNQLFEGSWTVKAFGNELTGGTGDSEFYSATGIPLGIQCNADWPRCPFASTPTNGTGGFHALGGFVVVSPSNPLPYCAPWYNWQGSMTMSGAKTGTMRPANGETVFTTQKGKGFKPIPPLYRNYQFFTASTSNAMPNQTSCVGTSTSMGGFPAKTTGLTGGPGKVNVGNPVTGTWSASTSTVSGNFNFGAAPANGAAGVRIGQGDRTTMSGMDYQGSARSGAIGQFHNTYPYVYSYTYATLRNAAGDFGAGEGPGNFFHDYGIPAGDAQITIKEGPNRFGGTMRMLGALTTKVCYFRDGGCSMGRNNWRYESIGASANLTYTSTGTGSSSMVRSGLEVTNVAYYYHTALMQQSTVQVEGERFPWTTGSVTVKATGRGPHKTVHYAQGFDNRNTTTSLRKGTIQLVTPVLTRWMQPAANFETGGIGILRIKFIPEPQMWAMLAAGASLLAVGSRLRGR